jgi:glycosyltransferase involved in cell wall biosynthesis
MLNWEKKVLDKSSLIITASKWAQEALIDYYKVPIARIMIIPIPSSLPNSVIPRTYEQRKGPGNELHLLSVAKNYQFKGVDIAIQTVEMLRIKGINASLHVVGMKGESTDFIKFMGLCKKKNPNELAQYVAQYKWADLLIHPARVEAAGIVCSEAAAFGVPTITNASGGLATTVEDGVSGIVLPINSPAEMYAEAIEKLLENRQQYFELQKSTRQRFETELNWDVAGNRIIREIHRVLEV